MAPSSDRDKDANDAEPKTDNPFIKFRQFADSQISSLLQGIVGLPSAFTKNPNNARWAGFDEDMRRRDELQKKQSELRESETRRQSEGRGWSSWQDEKSNTNVDEEMDDRTARDMPLYSPVSMSLFAHLRDAKDDIGAQDGWKPIHGQYPLSLTPSFYDLYRGYRSHSEPIKALRSNVYRDLQINPILRSDYSLLPYLLFSPYSPLKIESDETMRPWSTQSQRGYFPCFEAFEDLILTMQGRPMGTLIYRYPEVLPMVEPERGWIYNLWAHGILQQSSTTKYADVVALQRKLAGELPPWMGNIDSTPKNTQSDEDATTEQEMYERFLRRAASPAGIAEVLESLFTDAEGWINKQLASLDPAEMKRQIKELTDGLEKKTGNDAEDEKRAKTAQVLESLFTQAAGLFEIRRTTMDGKRTVESFAETKIGKELEGMKHKAAADLEKAVFTSTMTEHTTNEDGSVETSVTVWKRYADGRETTTTTSHTEEPPCCDDDDNSHSRDGREQLPLDEKVDETKEAKKTEKKGWFWN
jgi:hypothetical protein